MDYKKIAVWSMILIAGVAFWCFVYEAICKADSSYTANSHCGDHYTIVPDGHGGQEVTVESECVTTPNDWKES